MPNCNCFENENTTDRVNTNGLQRLDGSENVTVFENKIKHNMKQTIKLKESQLRNMIREAINEIGDTEKGQEALGALHAKKVYDKYRDDYKKTGKPCGHVRTDDEARVLNYAVDKQSKSKDPVGMKSAYDNGYVKQRDKENAKGINESKLDSIIKESINKVLNESRYADAIADRLFAQLENPNTPIYKKNQIKQELISMGYLQMPNKQSQQTTQQRGGDIYSQTIQALNSNNYAFFNNGNGRQLQGVLSGLYNQGKITYNEYNKGMQWIGQGFQYSNASGKYNW
jgi:predicted component of type VI protein secretion system